MEPDVGPAIIIYHIIVVLTASPPSCLLKPHRYSPRPLSPQSYPRHLISRWRPIICRNHHGPGRSGRNRLSPPGSKTPWRRPTAPAVELSSYFEYYAKDGEDERAKKKTSHPSRDLYCRLQTIRT